MAGRGLLAVPAPEAPPPHEGVALLGVVLVKDFCLVKKEKSIIIRKLI